MNQATGLDRVGIVGRDLGSLAAAFAEGGYLEPISTVDGGTGATLGRFLATLKNDLDLEGLNPTIITRSRRCLCIV